MFADACENLTLCRPAARREARGEADEVIFMDDA